MVSACGQSHSAQGTFHSPCWAGPQQNQGQAQSLLLSPSKSRALQKFHLLSNAGTREGSKNSVGQKEGCKNQGCVESPVFRVLSVGEERSAFFQDCFHFAANVV